LPSNQVHMHPG